MMITVAIVPIIVVYLLLSKYFIAGVTLGGVKEYWRLHSLSTVGL